MTTRNRNEADATLVAEIMVERLKSIGDEVKAGELKKKVEILCLAHPVPDSFV